MQKLYQRIDAVRTDYINKTIAKIVKTKPSYIAVEDLNVLRMMKNRYLSKAVASQKFYEFRTKLKAKRCHCCGEIKKDLKLSDRIYRCACGYVADRHFNASLNLKDAVTYEIA